jgi:hypothetical protein
MEPYVLHDVVPCMIDAAQCLLLRKNCVGQLS